MKVETGAYTIAENIATAGALTSAVRASETVTLASLPQAGDTLTIGTTIFTFRDVSTHPLAFESMPRSAPGRFPFDTNFHDIKIGATIKDTRENLVAGAKRNSTVINLVNLQYLVAAGAIEVVAYECGTGGNAIALAQSGGRITLGAATLTGGVALGTGRYRPAPAFIAGETATATVTVPADSEVDGTGTKWPLCAVGTTKTINIVDGTTYNVITMGCDKKITVLR